MIAGMGGGELLEFICQYYQSYIPAFMLIPIQCGVLFSHEKEVGFMSCLLPAMGERIRESENILHLRRFVINDMVAYYNIDVKSVWDSSFMSPHCIVTEVR